MREKTVKRYYCDHCSKGGFRKPDMLSHEMTCTKNPKRGCYLCDVPSSTFDYVRIAAEMIRRDDVTFAGEGDREREDAFETKSKDAITWLYGKVDGCPACVLSVLRQGTIYAFDVFDYKEELSEWHREKSECVSGIAFGVQQ